MEQPVVSVVIPIYNVEKYLDRCITSVVSQTYTNLEIILVDDGSPDGCPAMCDAWAQKDARIKVVHKKNAGLGFARNTGIEHATGRYICFFDSDDYVEPNTIEVCCRKAQEAGADIVCFGNDTVLQDGRVVGRRIPTPPKAEFSGEEIRNLVMPYALWYNPDTGEDWNFSLSAWSALFSLDRIRESGFRFVSEREIISEDIYSVLDYYQYVRKAVILPDIFYHYVTNPISLSRSYRTDRYDKVKYMAHRLTELSHDMGCAKILEKRLAGIFLGLTIGILKQVAVSQHPRREKRRELGRILKDEYLQQVLHTHDFSGERPQKKVLFWAMKNRMISACHVLVGLRNRMDG